MKNLIRLLSLFILPAGLFISCDGEDTPAIEIEITADKTSIVANGTEVMTFTVKTTDGSDVTDQATFYVDNIQLTDNTFTTLKQGSFGCYAEYKGSKSSILYFSSSEVPVFVKNILIENYTATWCGYCPRVHDAIKDAMGSSSHIVPIAIHGSNDPYYFTSIGTLAGAYNVSGYPTAVIDRDYSWPYPEEFDGLSRALDKNAALGISISNSVSGTDIQSVVKVKFGKTFEEDLKIGVCLLESNLIYDQTNYYDDGRGDPIEDYEHDHVLRSYGTDLFGDAIIDATTENSESTLNITFDMTDYVTENCSVVAFVINEDGKVLNAQIAAYSETVDYELLTSK